jgi:hypothetical protein
LGNAGRVVKLGLPRQQSWYLETLALAVAGKKSMIPCFRSLHDSLLMPSFHVLVRCYLSLGFMVMVQEAMVM